MSFLGEHQSAYPALAMLHRSLGPKLEEGWSQERPISAQRYTAPGLFGPSLSASGTCWQGARDPMVVVVAVVINLIYETWRLVGVPGSWGRLSQECTLKN